MAPEGAASASLADDWNMLKKHKGFTLIELLVVLVIVVITLSAAVPSFQGMVARNRIATQTNELLLAINLARSEALRLGRVVSVQAVSPGDSADEFGGGWCVIAGDASDVGPADCGGTPIRTFEALSGESTLDAVEDVDSIQFNSLGALTQSGTAVRNFDLCYPGQDGRRIRVELTGRSRAYTPDEVHAPSC